MTIAGTKGKLLTLFVGGLAAHRPTKMMLLEKLHAHPRDARIRFFEDEHYYTVDGERYPVTVSGVYHHFFPVFDGEAVVDKYYDSWKAKKGHKYNTLIQYLRYRMGMVDDEIKKEIIQMWSDFGTDRSRHGTMVHRAIELHLNSEEIPEEMMTKCEGEFRGFLRWREKNPQLAPYRTEWSIFHEDYVVAGQIDSLWKNRETGQFIMVDWKCVEEMKLKNDFGKHAFPPLPPKFADTNYWHYVCQQNMYSFILKEKYGIDVSSMYLLQLTPDGSEEHYVPDHRDLIKTMLDHYTTVIHPPPKRAKTASSSPILGNIDGSTEDR